MLKTSIMVAALSVFATGAIAQTAQTAQASQPPVTPPGQAASAADPTADQIASWIGGRHGEVDGLDAQPTPQRDDKVHGEVGASIGSGGYRSGYGVATMPVGDRGDLTVGVSDEHLGRGNRGYGPGGYGYGSGGDRRSLYIGLDMTGDHPRCDRSGAAAGGSPAPRNLGDPVWGSPGYGADPACAAGGAASQPAR